MLITGGGSGIGRLMAYAFAKEGCSIVLWDISKEGLDITSKGITSKNGIAYTFVVDVTDKEAVYKTVESMKKNIGKIDIIINNAGVVAGKLFWELTDAQIERVFKVNTLGPMYVTKAFLPSMMERNSGHIVTIASAAATVGTAKLSDYCASKSGVFAFAESLRIELNLNGYTGINTTIVCPYYIDTGMFDGVNSPNPLLPILQPDWVVSNIIHAVKTNQEELFLPSFIGVGYLARVLLPTKARDYILRLLGVARAMQDFQGKRTVTH